MKSCGRFIISSVWHRYGFVMSYAWLIKWSVWDNNSIHMSYGWVTKSSLWHNNRTPMPYDVVNKSSIWDDDIVLQSQAEDSVSHPYDLATIHLCHTDELISYPYDLAAVNPHVAAISYWRLACDDEMAWHYWLLVGKIGQLPVPGYPSQRVGNVTRTSQLVLCLIWQ